MMLRSNKVLLNITSKINQALVSVGQDNIRYLLKKPGDNYDEWVA